MSCEEYQDKHLDDERVKYWLYEFNVEPEHMQEFNDVLKLYGMSADEFFYNAFWYISHEMIKEKDYWLKMKKDMEEHPEKYPEIIKVVRQYPVLVGETEAMALKRYMEETTETEENITRGGERL